MRQHRDRADPESLWNVLDERGSRRTIVIFLLRRTGATTADLLCYSAEIFVTFADGATAIDGLTLGGSVPTRFPLFMCRANI